jgi:voltage-gated potassium channel
VDARSARIASRLQIPLMIAAVLTIPAIILEETHRGGTAHTVGLVANYVIWFTFAAELAIMLAVVPSRRAWLRHHPLEVIVVVLTPPFLLTAFQGVRLLRVLRVLRLFRLAPIARGLFSLEGLRYVGLIAVLVLIAGADGFASVEHRSFGNGVYWAITTMTTVGYGDITPTTETGKIIACVMMLVGVGVFAIITGAIAQQFLQPKVSEIEREVDATEVAEQRLLSQVRGMARTLAAIEQELQELVRERAS